MTELPSAPPSGPRRFWTPPRPLDVVLKLWPVLVLVVVVWPAGGWFMPAGLLFIMLVGDLAWVEMDARGLIYRWLYVLTSRIRWEDATSVQLKHQRSWSRMPRLIVRAGRKKISISSTDDRFDELAPELLSRLGPDCDVDEAVPAFLAEHRPGYPPWAGPWVRRAAATALVVPLVGTALAVWRTAIVGGVSAWISLAGFAGAGIIGLTWTEKQCSAVRSALAGFILFSLTGAWLAWGAGFLGSYDMPIMIGIGIGAMLLGAMVVTGKAVPGKRTAVAAVTVAMLVLVAGSLACRFWLSPYRHHLATVEELAYVQLDPATGGLLLAKCGWQSIDGDFGIGSVTLTYSDAHGASRKFNRACSFAAVDPSPDRRHVTVAIQTGPEAYELWLLDGRLRDPRRVAASAEVLWPCVWSPDGTRFIYSRDHNGRGDYFLVDARSLNERALGLVENVRILGWDDGNHVWTYEGPKPDDEALPAKHPLAIRRLNVSTGQSETALETDLSGWIVGRGSQPGIALVESERGYEVLDARRGRLFPWPMDGKPPVERHFPVLANRRQAIVAVSHAATPRVLCVDWESGEVTTLRRFQDGYRLGRVVASPDGKRVALFVTSGWFNFLEMSAHLLVLTPADGRWREQWIPVPGVMAMLDMPGMEVPGMPWLGPNHVAIVTEHLTWRGTDKPNMQRDLFVVPVEE